MNIVAFTPSEMRYNMMALYWGITPVRLAHQTTHQLIDVVDAKLVEIGYAKMGEHVVFIMGYPVSRTASTNMMKIHIIGELEGVATSAAYPSIKSQNF